MAKRTRPPQDRATPQPAATTTIDSDALQAVDRQRIAERAYERFQRRGGEPGRDQEDWFEAERELLGSN